MFISLEEPCTTTDWLKNVGILQLILTTQSWNWRTQRYSWGAQKCIRTVILNYLDICFLGIWQNFSFRILSFFLISRNVYLLIFGTWYPTHIQQWPSLFTTPYWCQHADYVSKLRVFFYSPSAIFFKKAPRKKQSVDSAASKELHFKRKEKNSLSLVSFNKWVLRLGSLWGEKSKIDFHFSLSDHFTWKYNGI